MRKLLLIVSLILTILTGGGIYYYHRLSHDFDIEFKVKNSSRVAVSSKRISSSEADQVSSSTTKDTHENNNKGVKTSQSNSVTNSESSNSLHNEKKSVKKEIISDNSVPQRSTSESGHNSTQPTTIKITSAAEAREHLKQQLGLVGNADIRYGNSPEYDGHDQLGQFFTIQMKSISSQKRGGTGTIAIYKVYQNGQLVRVQGA